MAIVTCVVTKLAGVTEPVSADTSILANAEFSASANAKIYHVFNFKRLPTENVFSRFCLDQDLNGTNLWVSVTTLLPSQHPKPSLFSVSMRASANGGTASHWLIEN